MLGRVIHELELGVETAQRERAVDTRWTADDHQPATEASSAAVGGEQAVQAAALEEVESAQVDDDQWCGARRPS